MDEFNNYTDEFNNYTDEFKNYTDEDFQTKADAISKTLRTLNKQLKENKHGLRAMGQEYYQAWAELHRIKTEKVKSAYAPLVNAKNELLKQAKKDKEVLKLQERYNRARSSPQTQHVSIESLNQLQRELEQKEQEVFNQLQTKYAAKLQALEKDATKAQQEFEKEMDEAVKAKGSIFDTLRANAKKLGEERRAIQQNTAKEKQNLTELNLQRQLTKKERQTLYDVRHKLTERRRSLQHIYEELESKVSQDTDVEKWAKAYNKAIADGTPKDVLDGIQHKIEQSKKTAQIKALQTQQTTINEIESDILLLEAQQNDAVIKAETRERAQLQQQLQQYIKKQPASTATKTVKKKPEWVRTLYTPSEIIAGKVPKGKTVHVPMKLVTANGQHYNEYTGISEEELVKKYHFPPDQAKKMAKQYSVEEYQKLDKVMVKPLKESATVSKMAKVPVGGKTTYNGPQDAGSKGTAYHTVAEMVFGDENWTVEEILSEFAKKKNKNATSRLTEKQYNDLSGLTDIYNVLGFKTQGKKAQTAAATHLNSFVDMLRPAIQAYGKPIMERTLGGVTTLEDGKLAAWGGTFDMLLGNLLLDLKSNQKMGNSMGWQLNMLKFLLDIAREAGMTVPEITSLEIAHQPAVTGKNKHLSPSPSINKIRSIGHDNMSNYILDILHQTLDPHPKTYYNAKPFEKEGQLIPHLTTGKFLTEEGKEVTTWKDVNYGYLKEMLNVRRSEESLAQLAAYMKENYTPAELSQVYRTLYGTTQYSEVIAKEGERKGQPLPVKTPVDIFTAGNTWDPKDTSLQDALWTLQKLMLPTAIQSGQSGVITESSFMGDNGEYVDTAKLNDFNVKDLAVMYKTAVQKKEINLANSITKYVANTLKDYFKDANDTESIRLGQQVANQINNLYTKAHTTEGEIAYENFAIAIGENLGIDYHKHLDPTTGRYVTARTPEFDLSNNAARKFAPNVETAVDYDFFSTRTDDTAEREIQRLAQSGSDNFYNIRAFDRQYDEFNDQEFARDVYERNTISPDHLANWIYGVMHQEAKINTLFEPYYNSVLKKNNLTSEQVSFDDFVKRILADDPALYQQYRDSQKLQEAYTKAAGVSFGTFGTTAEQAARGFEGIKQFLGSQLPQNLTLESDALYNSWNLATDKQALDKILLFYAQGGRPEFPFGKDIKNNPTLLSRLARREGTRFYGRSDKMGDVDNIPSEYREELQNLKTSIADINQATDAVIDNMLVEDPGDRTQKFNEYFEKYIGSNKKLSQKEKDASLNAVMNPATQRYYKQLRDALKQYRSLVGNDRAKIVFDPEDKTVYGGAFVNGKFQEISEQDLPNEYSEQIGEALDRWHEAYAELLVRTKKHDLPVLREMYKYDQKAESYAKIDKEIDKQVAKTQKIQITDQMVQDFYDSAQEKLLKPFKKNPQTSNNKPFKLSKNSGRWALSDDSGPSVSDLRDIQLEEDVDRWLKIHAKDKHKADPAALTKAVHDPKLYQITKDAYGAEAEFARLLGWDYQAGKTSMGARIDPTSKDIIYTKSVQDRVDQLRAKFAPSTKYSTWEAYEQALKQQVIERDRLAAEQANYLAPDVANGYDATTTNRAALAIVGARVRQELNPSLPTQELTPALEERTKTEAKSIEVDKESAQALQGESDAVKDKVSALKELITALKEKTDAEQQGIVADQKSEQAVEKSTEATHKRRKKITASDSLKQQLENQKVREEIAESKAREAAALAKTGNGKGKTQGAGEKEDFNQYKKNLNEITKAMNERDKIEKELATTPSMLSKGRTAREQLLVEYEGIISKLTTENELLIEQGRLSKEQVAQIEAEAQARRKLNSLKVQGSKYGANTIFDTIHSGIKNTIARMFDYTGVYRALNKMIAAFTKVIQLAKELDTSLFNLRVVSGDSQEQARGLISSYNDLAKQLGATTVEIANAANEWMRQGYEAQQATKLITASTYLSKLGMIDAAQATQYLTSMLKGFNLEVTNAVEIVDKLTKLDMVSATSAGGLAKAMQNVASSAQLANVSMDKTLAYAATIIETTQRDESSVGMALRTILARYGNVKAGAYSNLNLEATGDTDLENLNDVEKVLKKIGISIRSSATEFKSFEQVLDEVGDKWERLDSVSRNAIATAFAGQRQREAFLVLMNNMDRVEELAEVSAEATGTATEKYSAYYETVEAATKRLQTAWENLSHSFEISGIVKGMTTFFTQILDKAPQVIKMFATIATQMNAWKIPTLFKAGVNAVGLPNLKRFLFTDNITQEQQKYLRLKRVQDKQTDWKTKTLETSQRLDIFGIKNRISEISSNIDQLVDALNRNTVALNTQKAPPAGSQVVEGVDQNDLDTSTPGKKRTKLPKFKLIKSHTKFTLSQNQTNQTSQLTPEQIEEFKLLKRQTRKQAIGGAAAAGLAAGVMGGIAQEGSTEAKVASGAVQGAAAALGGLASMWIGPLGTMLGSVIGDVLGPIVANVVDKEAINRKKEVERGQKQLELLTSMDSSLNTLDSTSKINQLSASDISTIRDTIESIDEQMASEDSNLQNYLENAFKAVGATKFFNNWETKLVTGTQEERRAITRALQLAKSEAETAAYESSMAEKKYAALTTAEAKVYYKKLDQAEFERAYIRSGVSEYSKYTLARKGVDEIIGEVAKQLEGVDLKGIRLYDSFGKLTEEADAYIRTIMKSDDQMQEMLAGQTLTLQEAFSQENTALLEQFSTALGVSIEQLGKFKQTLGALTLGDLLAGMGETREKMSSYNTLLTDFFSTGTISPENLETLIANFPDLINNIGEPQDLLRAVQTKVSQLGTQYVSAGISSWFSSEAVYEQFKKAFEGKEGFGAIFEKSGLLGNIKSLDEAKEVILKMLNNDELKDKAQAMYDYIIEAGNAVQKELEYIKKQLEDTAELDAIMNVVDKNYEKQINALEEQKSALEQINNQREYENKLIEAKLKLENAQNEKKKVWREGVGWVYEADTSAIADAQKDLEDLENQKTIEELQAQIDELQAQRDYVANIPDRLELEQANENFKAWTDKLGLVNDDQLSVITKLQEIWTDLKTRSTKLEGEDQTKGQFDQSTQELAAASKALMGIGGTAAAPAAGSAQANLQEAYQTVKGFGQSDNSPEAQAARTKFADALKNYQTAYGDYISAGGTTSEEQEKLNALQADSDDLRFAPKWENVHFPGLPYKKRRFNVYSSFEDVTDSGGWKQGNMKDVVLISPIQGRADKEGLGGFEDVKSDKYNGQLFVNTYKDDQLFWVYNHHVYRATVHPEQYMKQRGVNDSTFLSRYTGIQNLTRADNYTWYADGTLSTAGGLSLVNDDPQYGLEGIITPQGTLTALPSKSGVVPADLTRNVWQLGEVAPNLIKQLVDINGKFSHTTGFGTDESFNVEHLDVHMVAQPGFDMDDFVRQLQAARNLTRHS